MKKFLRLFLMVCLLTLAFVGKSFAGAALSDIASRKEFCGNYYTVVLHFGTTEQFRNAYKFVTFYPETEKKANLFGALGMNYDAGELYFLEVPEKNNGLYVSFNENNLLDAVLVEVKKDKQYAFKFAGTEVEFSIWANLLLPEASTGWTPIRDGITEVIRGTKPYFDFYTNKGFYVRIKALHSNDFYRVAIYRPEEA